MSEDCGFICKDNVNDWSTFALTKEFGKSLAVTACELTGLIGEALGCPDKDNCVCPKKSFDEWCPDTEMTPLVKQRMMKVVLEQYGCPKKIDDDKLDHYKFAHCLDHGNTGKAAEFLSFISKDLEEDTSYETAACQQIFGPEFLGSIDGSCFATAGRLHCWRGKTLGDKEECCIKGFSTTGTCNPDHVGDVSGECDTIMNNYCAGYNIFTRQRCRDWEVSNPTAAAALKAQYCNMADRVDKDIPNTGLCRNWCATHPGKCDTGTAVYCATVPEWDFDPYCSCVKSDLIQNPEAEGQPQCFDPSCTGADTGLPGYLTQSMDADCGQLCLQKVDELVKPWSWIVLR